VALAASLQSEHCKLTSLGLTSNSLGHAGGAAVFASLQSQRPRRLTSRNCHRNW
jgi:hypothetical protein